MASIPFFLELDIFFLIFNIINIFIKFYQEIIYINKYFDILKKIFKFYYFLVK